MPCPRLTSGPTQPGQPRGPSGQGTLRCRVSACCNRSPELTHRIGRAPADDREEEAGADCAEPRGPPILPQLSPCVCVCLTVPLRGCCVCAPRQMHTSRLALDLEFQSEKLVVANKEATELKGTMLRMKMDLLGLREEVSFLRSRGEV
eukprot:670296-Rhodomonas_salina.1